VAINFKELTPGEGRMKAGCSFSKGGASTIDYLIQNTLPVLDENGDPTEDFQPVLQVDLVNIWTYILGDVDLNGGAPNLVNAPSINRTLPAVHPLFPYWYALEADNLSGTGRQKQQDYYSIAGQEDANALSNYSQYEAYTISVNFGPVPWAMLDNASILNVTMPPPSNSPPSGIGFWYFDGTPKAYTFSTEYARFTDLDYNVEYNVISLPGGGLTAGGMSFFDTNATPSTANLNGSTFLSAMRKQITDVKIKLRWHMVPFRYFTSPYSYLRRFAGMVNQTAFSLPNFAGNAFNPGQMLYLGAEPTLYNPPVPRVSPTFPLTFDTEKICDVEMNFIVTNRYNDTVPNCFNPFYANQSLFNPNWIFSGHNLQPFHGDNQFHAVATGGGATAFDHRRPFWLSFPFELLFTDPDWPQPDGSWYNDQYNAGYS
jgi:hypothetical protein